MRPSKTVEAPRFELGTSGPRLFPFSSIGTFELLEKLNTQIYRTFAYKHRDDQGVQLP